MISNAEKCHHTPQIINQQYRKSVRCWPSRPVETIWVWFQSYTLLALVGKSFHQLKRQCDCWKLGMNKNTRWFIQVYPQLLLRSTGHWDVWCCFCDFFERYDCARSMTNSLSLSPAAHPCAARESLSKVTQHCPSSILMPKNRIQFMMTKVGQSVDLSIRSPLKCRPSRQPPCESQYSKIIKEKLE